MTAETVPCPGCTSAMLVEQVVCAVCRRPRDEFEIEAGKNALAARARAMRTRPFKLLLAAAAAAAAYAAFQARGPVLARVARERTAMAEEMERIADPAKRPGGAVPQTEMGKRLIAALGRPQEADADAARPSTTIRMSARPAAEPAEGTPAAESAPPRPAGPARAPGSLTPPCTHKVYGVVYEFATGMAVPGAEVSVQQTSRAAGTEKGPAAVTDADGFYEIDFGDASVGVFEYALIVRRAGVVRWAVEDSDPPYRVRTEQMRREDLAALRDHDDAPIALSYARDEVFLHHDVVVLPVDRAAGKR